MAASTTRTVKAKFDGDAKGLIAAAAEGEAAVDRFGKNTEKKFNKSGEKAAKGFSNSVKKWFGGSGGLKEIGDSGGTVFGSGFLGALKTPVLGPAIAAAMTAAVAVSLPAVGAVAASGIVAGAGAGLAGLGLLFAAKSELVKKKWRDTTTAMGKDLTLWSKPFESTLTRSADFAQRTFKRFGPDLKAEFKNIAPVLTDFSDQVFRGLERLQPAVRPLSQAFQAVVKSLGPATQSALAQTSHGFVTLAESVKKNPDGLADLVDGMGSVVDGSLQFVAALNNINGAIEDLTGGTSAVDLVFGKANGAIGNALNTVQRGINPFTGLKDAVGFLAGNTEHATDAVVDQNATLGLWTQGLTATQAAAVTAAGGQATMAKATEATATKIARQTAATNDLIVSLFRLQGLSLGLSQSQIQYQQAIDDATASLKQNGRTLDIHTEKGRANQSALNGVAEAANQQTEAMLRNNSGTAAAAKTAEASRSNFIRLATQMGMSKKAAAAMAAQMIAIPNVSRTAKLQANKKDLEAKIASATKQLADKRLTATKKAKLQADIANARAGISTINGMLANLPSSKTITIKYQSGGIPRTFLPGSSTPGRASGGEMQAGRRYLLGERRAEIVEMGQNGGAKVISGEQTPRELAGAAAAPIIVENHIEIGGEVVRVVRTEISADKRETKRKVGAR